jgi:hypothetical protein
MSSLTEKGVGAIACLLPASFFSLEKSRKDSNSSCKPSGGGGGGGGGDGDVVMVVVAVMLVVVVAVMLVVMVMVMIMAVLVMVAIVVVVVLVLGLLWGICRAPRSRLLSWATSDRCWLSHPCVSASSLPSPVLPAALSYTFLLSECEP